MAAADKHTRIIELEDAQLREMVEQKGRFVEEGRSLARMMEETQGRLDSLGKDMQSLTGKVITFKHKIFKRLKKVAAGQLSENEIPVNVELRDGKIVLTIEDAVAQFKDQLAGIDKFAEPVPLTKKLKAK